MKSHDFGQFLFNSSILNELQIGEVIKLAKNAKPTLATEALFLQLVTADELTQDDDDFVRSLITPRQVARALELQDGQSLWMAQALIDNGIADFLKLDQILEKYNDLEIPPIESVLTKYYEKLKTQPDIDFPFAIDVVSNFHSFLSETFKTSMVLLPPANHKSETQFGASVKIIGEVPVVVALLADEKMFFNIAEKYDSYTETMEDAYDSISELLNVFTGQFVVHVAVTKGLEEVPEPPRYGTNSNIIDTIAVIGDMGTFYIYIGKQEIFN